VPLESYSRDDIRREYGTRKGCAAYCTVNCVQQVGLFDNWRSPQRASIRLPGVDGPTPAGNVSPAAPAVPGDGVLAG
jgi:hypothetical protein